MTHIRSDKVKLNHWPQDRARDSADKIRCEITASRDMKIKQLQESLERKNKMLERISNYIFSDKNNFDIDSSENLADIVIRLLQEKDEKIERLSNANLELVTEIVEQDIAIEVLANKI